MGIANAFYIFNAILKTHRPLIKGTSAAPDGELKSQRMGRHHGTH